MEWFVVKSLRSMSKSEVERTESCFKDVPRFSKL